MDITIKCDKEKECLFVKHMHEESMKGKLKYIWALRYCQYDHQECKRYNNPDKTPLTDPLGVEIKE